MSNEKNTDFDFSKIDEILERHEPTAVIAILQDIQEIYRYLPPQIFPYLAKKLNTSEARIYSVATFYENFSLEPKGGTTYIGTMGSQFGKKESIKDTARVLGRMYEGIEYRGFGQEIVEELAQYAGVPVWNGLTNEYHPTQMLADMLTIREHFGKLKGLKLVYMGDARYNMGNSLMIACAKLGLDFVACTTEDYFPNEELVEECRVYAKESGSEITLTSDVKEGTKGADVIYTDVWVSMGEPDEVWEKRIRELTPYKVTKEVMENAKPEAIFLHCLPAFHDLGTKVGREIGERFGITDMEVTDEVFESEQSKVFDEAENRMHTIKAVMDATLK